MASYGNEFYNVLSRKEILAAMFLEATVDELFKINGRTQIIDKKIFYRKRFPS